MMRILTLTIALLGLLALPAFALAQDPGDLADETPAPTVHVEQANHDLGGDLTVPDIATGDASGAETAVETNELTPEEAAMQEGIGSRSWWYLVGAIVVAGVVLAVLL